MFVNTHIDSIITINRNISQNSSLTLEVHNNVINFTARLLRGKSCHSQEIKKPQELRLIGLKGSSLNAHTIYPQLLRGDPDSLLIRKFQTTVRKPQKAEIKLLRERGGWRERMVAGGEDTHR